MRLPGHPLSYALISMIAGIFLLLFFGFALTRILKMAFWKGHPEVEKQHWGWWILYIFSKIVLPIIRPGVITAALFAFILSFDEVVIAAFIGGYRMTTLPKKMFENVRDEMDPRVAAISNILVLIGVLLPLTIGRLNRQRCARLAPRNYWR